MKTKRRLLGIYIGEGPACTCFRPPVCWDAFDLHTAFSARSVLRSPTSLSNVLAASRHCSHAARADRNGGRGKARKLAPRKAGKLLTLGQALLSSSGLDGWFDFEIFHLYSHEGFMPCIKLFLG